MTVNLRPARRAAGQARPLVRPTFALDKPARPDQGFPVRSGARPDCSEAGMLIVARDTNDDLGQPNGIAPRCHQVTRVSHPCSVAPEVLQ